MTCQTALLYHEAYDGRGFARLPEAWARYRLARDLMQRLDLPLSRRCVRPAPASLSELLLAHDPGYLALVEQMDRLGHGFLDQGATPAYRGLFDRARVSVGATLLGARLVASGTVTHAFNPSGGLHHARWDRAAGFCVFNDLVIAVRALQREYGYRRIAIVDCDGHHGDGTQALLESEPVLVVSLHRYDPGFYPGSGHWTEQGRGPGYGHILNVPLPRRTGDAHYLTVFETIVVPAVRRYRPEFLIVDLGADVHWADPLVRLGLTTAGYVRLAHRLHDLAHDLCAGRLLVVGGGGYAPEAVARCWALAGAVLCDGRGLLTEQRLRALHDAAAPEEPPEVGPAIAALLDQLSAHPALSAAPSPPDSPAVGAWR